jgi:hypothetical protein
MIEAQKRVVLACWQAHSWDWVPVDDLWDADEAADAIPKAVAAGWLLYDERRHAVRTTVRGRLASGLPLCSFPRRFDRSASGASGVDDDDTPREVPF